jgi:hypothetical protein
MGARVNGIDPRSKAAYVSKNRYLSVVHAALLPAQPLEKHSR